MKLITRARAGYLATLAVGTGIGIALFGVAAASPATPAGTVTHHYSLAASAFAPDGLHNYTMDYFNHWNPSTLSNNDSSRCFNAGLSLPTGVTMKSITVYYTRGSAPLQFNINRQDLPKHTFVLLADDITPTGTSAYSHFTRSIKKADAGVNYTFYAYSVGVCTSGTTTFTGITITYTQPS